MKDITKVMLIAGVIFALAFAFLVEYDPVVDADDAAAATVVGPDAVPIGGEAIFTVQVPYELVAPPVASNCELKSPVQTIFVKNYGFHQSGQYVNYDLVLSALAPVDSVVLTFNVIDINTKEVIATVSTTVTVGCIHEYFTYESTDEGHYWTCVGCGATGFEAHEYVCDCATVCSVCGGGEREALADHVIVDGVCINCGEPGYILYDVDGNGVFNVLDLCRMLGTILFGPHEFPVNQNCDFNFDGKINLKDLAVMAKALIDQ